MRTITKLVEIYTDGACRGNPGPGGWGALLKYQNSEKKINGSAANTTNNRMELTAAIEALKIIKQPCKIKLTTDSQYVKKGITEWLNKWKTKNWLNSKKEPVKNADLWKELDLVTQKHQISWHWVKGHSGHRENEIADQLANLAIESMLNKNKG